MELLQLKTNAEIGMPSSTISFLFNLELLWVITRFRMVVGHIAATELLHAADLARKV
jgi:hypothetical protein